MALSSVTITDTSGTASSKSSKTSNSLPVTSIVLITTLPATKSDAIITVTALTQAFTFGTLESSTFLTSTLISTTTTITSTSATDSLLVQNCSKIYNFADKVLLIMGAAEFLSVF